MSDILNSVTVNTYNSIESHSGYTDVRVAPPQIMEYLPVVLKIMYIEAISNRQEAIYVKRFGHQGAPKPIWIVGRISSWFVLQVWVIVFLTVCCLP